MIEIKNLKKTFHNTGTKALKGIDLYVKKGEFLSILGPSGSGKTTLLRSINGLETIDKGEIFLDNEKLTNVSFASSFTIIIKVSLAVNNSSILNKSSIISCKSFLDS